MDHLWETMKEQVSERPCQLFGCEGQGLGSCRMRNELDIWVMGTPCPPFSDQNVSRRKPGAVEGHALYSVTFKDALAAICSGHKAYLLEQVPGFNKPYDSGSSETPLDRPLGMVCCSVQSCKAWRKKPKQQLSLKPFMPKDLSEDYFQLISISLRFESVCQISHVMV